jgi:hypothetical protein
VTVTVDPVNDDPVATDDEATTGEDTPIDIAVLDNDDDVDDEDLTVSITVEPENGTAEVNEDGTVTYTPDEDFNGEDSFEYEAADDEAGADTAEVSITVDPINDDPIAENDSGSEYRLNTGFSSFITGDVLANDGDVDGDELTVTFVDLVDTEGQVTYLGDGTFLYENTTGLGEGAEDSWSYEVSDGNGGTDTAIVTIRVNSVPVGVDDMPTTDEATAFDVSVLPNDTDGDSDTLTVVAIDTTGTVGNVTLIGGVVNYDPNGQFDDLDDGEFDTDSFTYTVADGFGGTDVVTVTVTIDGITPPP